MFAPDIVVRVKDLKNRLQITRYAVSVQCNMDGRKAKFHDTRKCRIGVKLCGGLHTAAADVIK